MTYRFKGFLGSFALFIIIGQTALVGVTRQASAVGVEAELGEALEWVLTHNNVGVSIVRSVTRATEASLSELSWKSFRERLKWENSEGLARHLESEGSRLQAELEAYRESKGRAAKGEKLLADERAFLNTRAESLVTAEMQRLLGEQAAFVRTSSYLGPRDVVSRDYKRRAKEFEKGASDPSPTEAQFDPNKTTDVRTQKVGWFGRRVMEGGAVKRMTGSAFFGEGDMISLFSKYGKPYTAKDLENFRNLNKVFSVLDHFGEMQAYMSAFLNESKLITDELMRRVSAEAMKFDVRDGSVDDFMKIVRTAGADLSVNEVTYSTIEKMLTSLKKSYQLGGEIVNGKLVRSALAEEEEAYWVLKNKIALIDEELKTTLSRATRRELMGRRDVTRRKLDEKARALEIHSIEFVRSHDVLELFANARSGFVGAEAVGSPVDLPDLFVVGQTQLDAWQGLYGRALKRSVNTLISEELSLSAKTFVGKTRSMIRQLNKETGGKFTASKVGLKFRKFATHHARVLITRSAVALGVGLSPELIERIVESGIDKYLEEHFDLYLKEAKDFVGWDEAPAEAPAVPAIAN